MRNALTVDLEEYFHVEAFSSVVGPDDWLRLPPRVVASTHRLLGLLHAHDVRATFFVVGWVAEHYPKLVREVHAGGHEIACHGYSHRPIYTMDRATFIEDLRRAKAVIEDATGAAITGYRAPTCSVVRDTLWALDVLSEHGFRYDSSIFPIHHDRYGIPEAPRLPHRVPLPGGDTIVEFPMSTLRLGGKNVPFCGGGYFRLLPYPMIRAALRHMNAREEVPGMVYVHPWELDPGQPRMPVRGLTGFRHYVNLHRTADKLVRLLQDFAFAPVEEVLAQRGFMEVAA